MKKAFILVSFFCFSQLNYSFAQASAWTGFVSDFSTGTNLRLPDAPVCTYIGGGALRLAHNTTSYFTNFEFNSPICVTNNFTFEYRVRNAPQYGGQPAFDVGFAMAMPQGEISASLMSNDIGGLPWTFVSINGQRRSNLPLLVRNLTEYSVVKVKCLNNVASFYHADTLLASIPYAGQICTISKLNFWFKGSGSIDWIKVTNLDDNKTIYFEDFTTCSSIQSPDATACQIPTVNISANSPCEGDTLRITTTTNRAASFEWAGPNGFSSTEPQVVIPKTESSAGGTYSLKTRFNVCQMTNQTVNVRIRATPKVNLGKDTIYCEPQTLTLTAGTAGFTYNWNDGSSNPTITVRESGTYAVSVTSTEGCVSKDTVKIDIPQSRLKTDLTTVNPTCFAQCNGSISASTSGGYGAPYNYAWSTNSNQNLCVGNYKLTVTDPKGCKLTMVTTLVEPPKLAIKASVTSQYNGYGVSCSDSKNGTATALVTGGNGNYTYKWQDVPNGDSASVSSLKAGVYTLFVADEKGCKDSSKITVTAPAALKMAYQVKNIRCFGEKNGSVTLNGVQGGVKPFVVKFNQKAASDSFARFDNLAAGFYTLQITDGNQCTLNDSLQLTEPPKMIPVTTGDTAIHFGDDVPLFAGLQTPSVLTSVKWTTSRDSVGLDCNNCTTTFAAPRLTTIFKVTMTDSFGCQLNKDIIVQVDKRRKVFAPTAFSPNEDGQNDRFGIFAGSGTRRILYMKVFNRWGSMLFACQNPTMYDDTDGWDGTYKGQALPSEVYIWIAEIEFEDGEREVFKGDVALFR
ncbi:MAG: gliding motility-associated C-terminal domain-containing protein [Saprospiraceae bacterium]|nr:gliding motility-associated C-terminal domain-containing protein [Saprospiraceae bacterium]